MHLQSFLYHLEVEDSLVGPHCVCCVSHELVKGSPHLKQYSASNVGPPCQIRVLVA